MTDLDALIRDLERAAGPDRELSDRVLLVFGWECVMDEHCVGWWHMPDGREYRPLEPNTRPHPTASLDDALSLVPEGWHIKSCHQATGAPKWEWYFSLRRLSDGTLANGLGDTFPLAVCIAVLKAQQNVR